MKNEITYFDYYSLYKVAKHQSVVKDFFIFDDINSFAENFHFNKITNYPMRLGMVAVIICRKGYSKLKIGLNSFEIKKDMTLVILPEQIFQILEVSSDFDAGYILLKEDFFEIRNDFKIALDLEYYFFKQPYVQLPEKKSKEGNIIFNLIKENIKDKNNLFLNEIVQTYMRSLFYLVSNVLIKSNTKHTLSHKEEIFEKFISLIQQNFRKNRNIGWYAEQIHLTPKYLSTLIFEVSGKHASNWIQDYIILEAKALLNSSSLTIQQISNELGFSNQSHFGSYFKRFTGLSPSEYRKSEF